MVDATKYIRKVSQTEPFSSLVVEEQLPGPDIQTDEQLYGTHVSEFLLSCRSETDPMLQSTSGRTLGRLSVRIPI